MTNMTGTKRLDAYRTISGTNYKIVFRAQWTFSFDRKNRLRTHTYAGGSNVRGNIWYDGAGRVWQRWNDDSVTGDWDYLRDSDGIHHCRPVVSSPNLAPLTSSDP